MEEGGYGGRLNVWPVAYRCRGGWGGWNREMEVHWVYRQPDTSRREETWRILERLGNSNHLSWLCIGDFNEIVSDADKLGGNLRSPKQMERFQDAINRCRFRDLGYVGPRFTWKKIFTNGDGGFD